MTKVRLSFLLQPLASGIKLLQLLCHLQLFVPVELALLPSKPALIRVVLIYLLEVRLCESFPPRLIAREQPILAKLGRDLALKLLKVDAPATAFEHRCKRCKDTVQAAFLWLREVTKDRLAQRGTRGLRNCLGLKEAFVAQDHNASCKGGLWLQRHGRGRGRGCGRGCGHRRGHRRVGASPLLQAGNQLELLEDLGHGIDLLAARWYVERPVFIALLHLPACSRDFGLSSGWALLQLGPSFVEPHRDIQLLLWPGRHHRDPAAFQFFDAAP